MVGGTVYGHNAGYSRLVGFIFIFNLIVGTGVLNMPYGFSEAGWILGICAVSLLGFVSYITATFVIESLSIANGIIRFETLYGFQSTTATEESFLISKTFNPIPVLLQPEEDDTDDQTPLVGNKLLEQDGDSMFELREKVELSQLAGMFYNRIGVILFYVCMCVYLYGDLAIYTSTISKTMRDVICIYGDSNITLHDSDPCWSEGNVLTRSLVYYLVVIVFNLVFGSFLFFNISKTKYLQYATTVTRWVAFLMILGVTLTYIIRTHGVAQHQLVDPLNIPALFGVSVYAFMCQHSLPSLLTPLRSTRRLFPMLAGTYALILLVYIFISLTVVFSFTDVKAIFTLNFEPNSYNAVTNVKFIMYYIALFPVFTLSTNFPILGVTLRENLKNLFQHLRLLQYIPHRLIRFLFPLLTLLPPFALAMISNDLSRLMSFTGGYAGVAIQYVIPSSIVWLARRKLRVLFGIPSASVILKRRGLLSSPFQHSFFVIIIFTWSVVSVVLMSLYLAQ